MSVDKHFALILAVGACHLLTSSLHLAEITPSAHDWLHAAAPILISGIAQWSATVLGSAALIIEFVRLRSLAAAFCAGVQACAVTIKWSSLTEWLANLLATHAPWALVPRIQATILALAIITSLIGLFIELRHKHAARRPP